MTVAKFARALRTDSTLRVDVCGYPFYVEPVASADAYCSDGMHLNKHQPGLRGRAKSRT